VIRRSGESVFVVCNAFFFYHDTSGGVNVLYLQRIYREANVAQFLRSCVHRLESPTYVKGLYGETRKKKSSSEATAEGAAADLRKISAHSCRNCDLSEFDCIFLSYHFRKQDVPRC